MTPYRTLIAFGLGLAAASSLTSLSHAADQPAKGGTLVYLEQQAHTNLYPPAGGFYPNGGVLNQITDKLTYQNPKTLAIEPGSRKAGRSTTMPRNTRSSFGPA